MPSAGSIGTFAVELIREDAERHRRVRASVKSSVLIRALRCSQFFWNEFPHVAFNQGNIRPGLRHVDEEVLIFLVLALRGPAGAGGVRGGDQASAADPADNSTADARVAAVAVELKSPAALETSRG